MLTDKAVDTHYSIPFKVLDFLLGNTSNNIKTAYIDNLFSMLCYKKTHKDLGYLMNPVQSVEYSECSNVLVFLSVLCLLQANSLLSL